MMKGISLLILLLVFGSNSEIMAGTITKTFEVGDGTSFGTSNRREFNIPCGIKPTVSVKYSRVGPAASVNDVPLTLQLMLPSEDGGETGRVVNTKEVLAKTTAQTATLSSDEANGFGCGVPWSFRVRATDGSPYSVTGEIRFTTPDLINLSPSNAGNISLNHGDSMEVDLKTTFPGGIGQGTLEIKGEWHHNLNVQPIRMKFELVDPKGTVVATQDGFPQNEIRPYLAKLSLNYRIREHIPGKWSLRVKNLDDREDAVRIKPIVNFKPGCP